jgi:hypothetical protein
VIRRVSCSGCSSPVIWATFADGHKRPVEDCPLGDGAIALQEHLFSSGRRAGGRSGFVEARAVRLATRFRAHVCQGRADRPGGADGERLCLVCRVPMVALERGRSVCIACQAEERAGLVELAAHLVDGFGRDGARAALEGVWGPRR